MTFDLHHAQSLHSFTRHAVLPLSGASGSQVEAGLINAWNWTPSDVVEVLLADEFFDLFAQTA